MDGMGSQSVPPIPSPGKKEICQRSSRHARVAGGYVGAVGAVGVGVGWWSLGLMGANERVQCTPYPLAGYPGLLPRLAVPYLG